MITNYFERCRSLGFCSVINSDKRKSQQNDEVKSSEASTDTAKTFCFNPQVVSVHNTIENNVKNLNKSEEREEEKEEVACYSHNGYYV